MLNKSRLALLLGLIPTFSAQAEVEAVGSGPMPSLASLMAQTAVGLVLVLAAILALAWVVKRLNVSGFGYNKMVQVVATLPVGTREKVVLIEVGGQQILLGVAPGRVSALHVLDEPVAELEGTQSKTSSATSLAARTTSEFSKKLSEFIGQGNKS